MTDIFTQEKDQNLQDAGTPALYIMRHGKTDWNARRKLQGRTDIPLNEEGRRAAREAAEKYREIPFDVCYASPLRRARETAEIFLAGRNVPIYTDERLAEMSFGIYEGFQDSFQDKHCPINVLFEKPVEYQAVEGGENLDDLFQRTGEFLDEVITPQIAKGRRILIVGHGAMNCSIIARFRGTPREKFWDLLTGNCVITRLV